MNRIEQQEARFVVIEPVQGGFSVKIQPTPVSERPRVFSDKNEAWSYARDLWSEHRLPLRDLTDGNSARATQREKEDDDD